MKKTSILGLILAIMFIPSLVSAQTAEETRDQLLATLMQMVQRLTEQLAELQAKQAAIENNIGAVIEQDEEDSELRDLELEKLRREDAQKKRGYWETDNIDQRELDRLLSELREAVLVVVPEPSSHILGGTCRVQDRKIDQLVHSIRSRTHKYNFPNFNCSSNRDASMDRRDFYNYVMGL